MTKQKGNVLLLISIIITVLNIVVPLLLILGLLLNIGGVKEVYASVIEMVAGDIDIESYVTMACFDLGLSALLNVYFAIFYIKGYRLRLESRNFARMLVSQSIWQMIIASLPAGIFALIAGLRMQKTAPVVTKIVGDGASISDYKLEAMKEAIARLNELKNRGVISEEEYYANLNKILES